MQELLTWSVALRLWLHRRIIVRWLCVFHHMIQLRSCHRRGRRCRLLLSIGHYGCCSRGESRRYCRCPLRCWCERYWRKLRGAGVEAEAGCISSQSWLGHWR